MSIGWRITKYIVPFGARQGSLALKLHAGEGGVFDDEHVRRALTCGEIYSNRIPVFLDEDVIQLVNIHDFWCELARPVHVCFDAGSIQPEFSPTFWRTALSLGESFYSTKVDAAEEVISDIHAPHMMRMLQGSIRAQHYFVMPFDDETEDEAREFVLSDANTEWRLTRRDFETSTVTELRRMMEDG